METCGETMDKGDRILLLVLNELKDREILDDDAYGKNFGVKSWNEVSTKIEKVLEMEE